MGSNIFADETEGVDPKQQVRSDNYGRAPVQILVVPTGLWPGTSLVMVVHCDFCSCKAGILVAMIYERQTFAALQLRSLALPRIATQWPPCPRVHGCG